MPSEFDVVVVGAGFAGLYMLKRLREQGWRAIVFEAGDGVGGTWYWNRYPGARCDVPSIEYSFSFDPELEQEWDWKERYATQPEILAYLEHVAERYDLYRDIRLRTRVESAHFDESSGRWEVKTDDGETTMARYVVMATGCLSSANMPDIPGRDSFEGDTYHTGRWPHHKVDYRAIRAENRVSPIGFGGRVRPAEANAMDLTPEQRAVELEKRWEEGGLTFLAAFMDVVFNPEANAQVADFVRRKIASIVDDPEVAAMLSPDTYIGCKRLCVDTGYFATFNRPNVRLVDLRKTPIVQITPSGVRTSDETFEFDAIVFATGFDAMTGTLLRIDIQGRDGKTLKEAWAEGPKTYLGLSVPDFPNMFIITGPGSPSVLTNMVTSIEQHVEWITDCINKMRDEGRRTIEAKPEDAEQWVAYVNQIAGFTLYTNCNSWYLGANIPGKPRVFMPLFGFNTYEDVCKNVVEDDYRGFVRV